MLHVLHRERTLEVRSPTGAASQFLLNQYYCYWVPVTKSSWCDVHQSPVWASSSATFTNIRCDASSSATFSNLQGAPHQVHHSPIYKGCTNLHCCASTVAPFYSVAPFVSYNDVPCDYDTGQFYIINNLATYVSTPCRLFNCIVEIYYLTTTEHVATCRRIYSTVVIQFQ